MTNALTVRIDGLICNTVSTIQSLIRMLIGFLIKILIVINLLIIMPRKRKGGGLQRKRKCEKHGNYTPDTSAPKFPNRRNGVERQGSSIPPSIRDDLENNHDGSTPESRRRCYRMAIQYQYIDIMDAPHKSYWSGKGGTISVIRKALHMSTNQRRTIKRTLQEITKCMREGVIFDGSIEKENKQGRKIIILPGSFEELLIANWMEAHCGFRFTTMMVNEHRRQQGDDDVSVYAVMAVFYRLKPKVDVIKKVQSGGHNEKWIQASYNVTKQMKIMLGELTEDEVMTDNAGKNCYVRNKRINLFRTQNHYLQCQQ